MNVVYIIAVYSLRYYIENTFVKWKIQMKVTYANLALLSPIFLETYLFCLYTEVKTRLLLCLIWLFLISLIILTIIELFKMSNINDIYELVYYYIFLIMLWLYHHNYDVKYLLKLLSFLYRTITYSFIFLLHFPFACWHNNNSYINCADYFWNSGTMVFFYPYNFTIILTRAIVLRNNSRLVGNFHLPEKIGQ